MFVLPFLEPIVIIKLIIAFFLFLYSISAVARICEICSMQNCSMILAICWQVVEAFLYFLPNCWKHSVVALYCNCHGVAQHPDCVGGEMEWWAIYLGCKLDAKAIFLLSPMRLQGCEETLNHDLYGRGIT